MTIANCPKSGYFLYVLVEGTRTREAEHIISSEFESRRFYSEFIKPSVVGG